MAPMRLKQILACFGAITVAVLQFGKKYGLSLSL